MINTNLIPFLIHLLALRDPHAKRHCNQVAKQSSALAVKIGLSSAEIENLEFAATIHDIGKIAINDFILNKPGRFTEAEYLMIQHHTVLGSNLVASLSLDPIIPAIILNHHENFDGSGYPNKKIGDQIPLEARIIRITDTYDALTSNRAYHPAYTHEQALNIMELEQHYFDPQLFEIFININYKEQ